MNKKIAILLASYNGIKYIKEQIDSILYQKEVEITIFISDDLSTDNTLKYLQNTYKDEKRLIYLKDNEKIGGAAKNFYRLIRDVDFSNFDYISLSDQDDIWYENKLIEAIKTIKEKQVDIYSSNVTAFWEDGKEVLIDKSQSQKEYDFLFSSAGPGCTYVMKKEFLVNFKTQMFKKDFLLKNIDLHDWLLYAYARTKNYKWFIDPIPLMLYRQHSNNEFGANSGFVTFKKRWLLARNGWYRKQILNIANFCDLENKITNAIKNNTFMDRLYLISNIFKLRKKISESIVLFFILVIPGFK
ncbi:glycosyltransferase [Aliarcobacter butzleri]|uniref:glycosyltransferase n=1 Tax=Aliarcobacter butzleri TaxID=28197 RepID=UPI0021B22AFB|nr:glycosyltransferase [Aliarcobacter butzleri]MCT7630670.1 glycosyltransferase [Aliarcobacter butzleri]